MRITLPTGAVECSEDRQPRQSRGTAPGGARFYDLQGVAMWQHPDYSELAAPPSTMTTILLAGGVTLAAAVLAVALFLLGRRSSAASEARLAAVAAQIDERMQAMVRDLSEALARAQEENRRGRVLGRLGGTIDLDEVTMRTLDVAGQMAGVDAAVVAMGGDEGEPLVAAFGVEGDVGAAVAGPPDGATPRAIEIQYVYSEPTDAIRGALAVPLGSEGEQLGYLTVFSRGGLGSLGEHAVDELEELALRAGPAIENARRFKEARQLADLDALTGLHNRRYFHELLAREVARAQRYDRKLALVVFDLDDFKAINDRIGHLAGDAVLAEAAERVREVVRSADIACRVGGDEFAVILPESTLRDADQLYRRLEHAVSARPVGQVGRLHLSAGVTELRPDDNATTLFERADEALYQAKDAGKATVVAIESPAQFPRPASGA
jgi:diguanylate cyclase (GGDEF)-like protein